MTLRAVFVFVLVLAATAGARAQSMDVLVRIDANDPVAEATTHELEQRGLRTRPDEPPHASTTDERAHESQVAALALGARAAVWIDAVPGGPEVSVRALRAEDGEHGTSIVLAADVRAEPRLAALVAGALLEEILSRSHATSEPAVALADPNAPAVRAEVVVPTLAEVIAPTPRDFRVYGTLALDGFLRFAPMVGGGISLRGASGLEWTNGLRIGAQVRAFTGNDVVTVDSQVVQRLASGVLGGAEIGGRFQIPGHALLAGAGVALGGAQLIDGYGHEIWDLLVIGSAFVGFAFPIGRRGAEMGLHLGVDVRYEPSRGVTPCPTLGLRWDWR